MTKKQPKSNRAQRSAHPYVIVRCTQAGVHAGILVSHDGPNVVLNDSRRLWAWRVPMGAPSFLSGVATHGLDHGASKVGTPLQGHRFTEASEVIPCSVIAERSIRSAPEILRVS